MRSPEDKLLNWSTLLKLRLEWRKHRKIVVWTNGCFDILHVGHIRSLFAAKQLGDVLVVGLNSDTSIRILKGDRRPIIPGPERLEIVAALECVDFVVLFDDLEPSRLLADLQPDVHCKGSDYAPPHGKPIPESVVVAKYGGRIEFIPIEVPTSTTTIINTIADRS